MIYANIWKGGVTFSLSQIVPKTRHFHCPLTGKIYILSLDSENVMLVEDMGQGNSIYFYGYQVSPGGRGFSGERSEQAPDRKSGERHK
jgi:hypothetical protein